VSEGGVTADERLAEWHRYYTEKRIGHQWFQVHLLEDLSVKRVLEVGPYLGLVTGLLDNAGYQVTTLDFFPRQFARPDVPHLQSDLTKLAHEAITGFDLILCCETLEHLPWEKTGAVLQTFQKSGARYLITSVPYEELQAHLLIDWNLHRFRQRFAFRKGRSFRRLPPPRNISEHHWEVGYRGFSLKAWEDRLQNTGWRILRRDFTAPCRSVFHVLENDTRHPPGSS
jgi:hypothetical protein